MQTTDAVEWWAGIAGEAAGPLSLAELRARREAGEVTPSTLVWRAGFSDWKPAAEVAELAELFAPAAGGGWKPRAGSALAELAGAELAAIEAAPKSRGDGASASPRLDELTRPPPPNAPAPNGDARRRTVLTSAAGTFAMGAAVAVALLVVFRGENREPAAPPPARAAASVPAPLAAAPAASSAQPEVTGSTAPAAAPQTPTAASSNTPVEVAEAVRASDPPAAEPAHAPAESPKAAPAPEKRAASAPAKPPRARASKPARAERSARTPRPAVARARAPEAVPPKAAPAPKEPRVAAVAPRRSASAVDDPLAPLPDEAEPAGAAAAPRRTASDPLASLVTDEDLARELSGAGARAGGTAPAKTSGSTRSGASTAYVPPAPGADLPEEVSSAEINAAVKARIAALRSCIDEQRSAEPGSKGTLRLRWLIAGDGSVKEVRNLSPEFEGKPISSCIGRVVQGIQFPRSRTTGQEVVFPFRF